MEDYLQKEASKFKSVGKLLYRIFGKNSWEHIAKRTARAQKPGKIVKGLDRTAKFMTSPYSLGLDAYGLSSLIPGLDLPGSDLALWASMPGIATATKLPAAITSARMNTDAMQDKIKGDVQAGSNEAVNHFITAAQTNPDITYEPGRFLNLLRQVGFDNKGAQRYMQGVQTPQTGFWERLNLATSNPSELMSRGIDKQIKPLVDAQLNKSAGVGGAIAKTLATVLGLGATGVLAHQGYNSLKDKPYDQGTALRKGYDATRAVIQDKVNKLSQGQKLGLRIDPTMAVQELEKSLPGSIKSWEQQYGVKFAPGWLARMRQPGKEVYYTTDMHGRKHYIS